MRISSDGRLLEEVDNSDIVEGGFIWPVGVTAIGNGVFAGCERLETITLPVGVTAIGAYAFDTCSSLTAITLPAGVTAIGVHAFEGCYSLKTITLPVGVMAIGNEAFINCDKLHKIIVNTDSDEEIARIKEMLPAEHRKKVIKKALYDDVVKFQKEAHKRIFNNLTPETMSPLVGYFYYDHRRQGKKLPGLTFDLLREIATYDSDIYKKVEEKMAEWPFPMTREAFEQYKNSVEALKPSEDVEARSACIMKLLQYIQITEKLKQEKLKQSPRFFDEHPGFLKNITERETLYQKVIEDLSNPSWDINNFCKDYAEVQDDFLKEQVKEFFPEKRVSPTP